MIILDISNAESLITSSWKRSEKLGIDPKNLEDDLLTGGELKDRKERLQNLFQACSPILNKLYSQLKNSLFMILVADPDGYIVFNRGKAPFARSAKKVWLDAGANWNENVKGTNAIGTALIEGKQISVIGDQHFSWKNRFLSCYSSPLYSPTGELLGVLDISGDIREHHPHIMGMVSAAAHSFQTQLLLQHKEKELTLSFQENDAIVNAFDQPLISVDNDGLIQRMNHNASYYLKQPIKQCIGRPLSNWFNTETVHKLLTSNSSVKHIHSESYTWDVERVFDHRQKVYRSILRSPSKESQNKDQSAPEIKQYVPK